jgi:hypothetical protein
MSFDRVFSHFVVVLIAAAPFGCATGPVLFDCDSMGRPSAPTEIQARVFSVSSPEGAWCTGSEGEWGASLMSGALVGQMLEKRPADEVGG